MEISEKIIIEAFSIMAVASTHESLETVLQELNNYSAQDILFKDNEALRKNNYDIHSIISLYLPGIHSGNSISTQDFSNILLTIKQYLDRAIANGDTKSLLIFLSVNCYFKIDINYFIKNDVDSSKLGLNILKLLENIKLETQLKPGAPYHEKELKAASVEGIREENIHKTYEIILSIERGGRGFHFNYLLENLISFLFQLNIKLFEQHLDSLKHPETVVFYLQSFSGKDLIKISNIYTQNNKWIHFELIRQLIEKEDENYDVNSKYIQPIIKSLNALHDHNTNIYKQTIIFFHRSKVFNSALGYQMKDLKENEIIEIFNDIIPLDKYNNSLDQRTILLEEFSKGVSEEVYHLALANCFKRWKNLFTSIAKDEDSYQSDLLITDYANFVIQYYIHLNDRQVIELMNATCEKIIWINSEWFKSQMQQITICHLYLTKIYFLSFAYKNKKLSNPATVDLVAQLKNNKQYWVKRTTNNIDSLAIIDANIK